MKLRCKQSLVFLLLSMLVWGAGYIIIRSNQEVVQRLMGKYAISQARYMLKTIDQLVYAGIEEIQRHEHILGGHEVLVTSNASFEGMEHRDQFIRQQDSQWQETTSGMITPFMSSTIDNALADYLREHFFSEKFRTQQYNYSLLFEEMILTNKYGANVAQVDRSTDYYQADEQWWQQAQAQDIFIGGVVFDESVGDHVLPCAIRIHDANHTFAGVIRLCLNVDDLIERLHMHTEKSLSGNARMLLLDRDRKVVYDETGLFEFQEPVGDIELFQSMSTHEGFFLEESILGDHKWLFSYVQSQEQKSYPNPDWLLMMVYDTTGFVGSAIRLGRNGFVLLALLTILIFILNVILYTSVSSRLRMLMNAHKQVVEGDFQTQVKSTSKDEIGDLARTFNHMVTHIQSTMVSQDKFLKESAVRQQIEGRLQICDQALAEARLFGSLASWEYDIQTQQVRWSPELYRLYEASPSRKTPTWEETMMFYQKEDGQRLQTQIQESIMNGIDFEDTYTLVLPSGLRAFHRIWVRPVKENTGGVTKLQGMVQDVTVYMENESTWQQEKQDLEHMLNSCPPFCIIDETFQLIKVNDALCDMMGVYQDHIIGKHCHEVLPGCHCSTSNCALKKIKEGAAQQRYESTIQTPDKGTLTVIINAIPYYDTTNHTLRGIIVQFKDITEMMHVKEARIQTQAELEECHRRLEQIQEQWQQYDKLATVGRLAAGMAQDLKRPIQHMEHNQDTITHDINDIRDMLILYKQFTERVSQTENPDLAERATYVREKYQDMKIDGVLENLKELLIENKAGIIEGRNLLAQLCEYAKPDQAHHRTAYNLNDGIRATTVLVCNSLDDIATIELQLTDIPPIYCQARQIREVLVHLILNAAEAIHIQEGNDKGTIYIKTYAEKDEVICEIHDDGPGIPQEHLSRIFSPCFSTKTSGKDKGWGLSMCRDVVENQYHGSIVVESIPGEGTKIILRFPVTKDHDIETPVIGGTYHD